jgi:hypothetical protein
MKRVFRYVVPGWELLNIALDEVVIAFGSGNDSQIWAESLQCLWLDNAIWLIQCGVLFSLRIEQFLKLL